MVETIPSIHSSTISLGLYMDFIRLPSKISVSPKPPTSISSSSFGDGRWLARIWISLGWNGEFMGGPGVYEIIPGFIAAFIAIVAVSMATEDANEYQHITR